MYRTRGLGWGARAAAPVALRGFGEQPTETMIPWNPRAPMSRPRVAGLGQDLEPYVVWDSTLTVSQGRQPVQNNGCPAGYFAQYVGPGEPSAIFYPGRTDLAIRCRLMATTTPQTIVSESGVTATEAMAVYTDAIKDTAHQVGGAVASALSWTPYLLIGGGILGGLLLLAYLK